MTQGELMESTIEAHEIAQTRAATLIRRETGCVVPPAGLGLNVIWAGHNVGTDISHVPPLCISV